MNPISNGVRHWPSPCCKVKVTPMSVLSWHTNVWLQSWHFQACYQQRMAAAQLLNTWRFLAEALFTWEHGTKCDCLGYKNKVTVLGKSGCRLFIIHYFLCILNWNFIKCLNTDKYTLQLSMHIYWIKIWIFTRVQINMIMWLNTEKDMYFNLLVLI